MFRRSTSLHTLVASLALLLAPLPGAAESSLVVGQGNASATLNFRIVIPPVMRVLENHHPSELQPDAAGELGGQQRLVVVSNMQRGFCVGLRAAEPQRAGWQLSTANTGGVTLTPVADGYRLCTAGPGRYTLLLEHRFTTGGEQWARRWPVQTDLMAM